MKYNIVVLDLDGTLTNSKKEVTPYTKETLFRYMEAGGKVVLASGRPTFGVMPVAEELELTKRGGYILSFNGGNIIDCKQKKTIYQKKLDRNIPARAAALAKEFGIHVLSYENESIVTENPEDVYIQTEAFINKMPVKKIEDFAAYVTFPVTKCLMTGDGERLAELEPVIRERLGHGNNVFRSEPFFLEVMPKGIDKAQSLGRLLAYLGMSPEEMAAFGDGYNDKSMLEYAGLGVAMANAQEAVKESARYIAPSNDEDGVARTVADIIEGKGDFR